MGTQGCASHLPYGFSLAFRLIPCKWSRTPSHRSWILRLPYERRERFHYENLYIFFYFSSVKYSYLYVAGSLTSTWYDNTGVRLFNFSCISFMRRINIYTDILGNTQTKLEHLILIWQGKLGEDSIWRWCLPSSAMFRLPTITITSTYKNTIHTLCKTPNNELSLNMNISDFYLNHHKWQNKEETRDG